MGLGITMNVPTKGLFRDKMRNGMRAYFEGLPSVVPGQSVRVYPDDHGIQIRLVPFEDNVYVQFEDTVAVISARTNSAGPGYHAYLVGVLDGLVRQTGAKLTAAAVKDETGYYADRDFQALQGSMAAWAVSVANAIIEKVGQGHQNLAVSMPLEQIPVTDGRVVSYPLGYLDEPTLRSIQRQEDLRTILRQFFLWWDEGLTADFFRKAALSIMWQDINWLPPLTGDDGSVDDGAYQSVLACLEQAWAFDTALSYPEAEWLEAAKLIGDDDLVTTLMGRFPDAVKKEPEIGFLRGWVNSMLSAGWYIEHPGKMYFDGSDRWVWWDDDLTIRVSVLSFQPAGGGDVDPDETLGQLGREEPFEVLALKDKKVSAKVLTKTTEEEGEMLWQTVLIAAHGNTVLMSTLYYADKALESLALRICRSLSMQAHG